MRVREMRLTRIFFFVRSCFCRSRCFCHYYHDDYYCVTITIHILFYWTWQLYFLWFDFSLGLHVCVCIYCPFSHSGKFIAIQTAQNGRRRTGKRDAECKRDTRAINEYCSNYKMTGSASESSFFPKKKSRLIAFFRLHSDRVMRSFNIQHRRCEICKWGLTR